MGLILRQSKGSKLTISEMDGNLIYLQDLALSGVTAAHPSGNDTEVQFNNNGAFGASSAFTFDNNTNQLNLNGQINVSNVVNGFIFSNPKNITGNIHVPDDSNAIIIGPDITYDLLSDITIGTGSTLTIFDPNYSFTGNSSDNCINNIWVQNLYACDGNLNINSNIVSTGYISATTFYGDGSNLTGISGGSGSTGSSGTSGSSGQSGTSGSSGTSGTSGTGSEFTGNTSGNQITQLWVSGDVHATSYYGDGSNLTGIVAGAEAIPVTYDVLTNNISTSALTPGTTYIITDYQTCYVQPDWMWSDGYLIASGNSKSGSVETLLVVATSVNTLAPQAYSVEYPLDKITYDVSYNLTEYNEPAKGRIIERITPTGNRADYDLRGVMFKRYDAYYSDQYLNKNINILTTGEVQGVSGQTFFSSLTTGNIIGIKDGIGIGGMTFYEITQIVDDVLMYVTGQTIHESYGVTMVMGNSFGDPISPYPTNIITNTSSSEHFTFDNGLENSYSNYLGNYANGGNEFLLSNNVFFGGPYHNNIFGTNSGNNTFDDDIDSIRAGVRFRNNIITNDFESNLIGDDFEYNYISCDMEHNLIGDQFEYNMITDSDGEDFDNNRIGNFFSNNFIPMYDQFTNNTIADDFSNNIILDNISDTLFVDSFNDNFVDGGIDSCVFNGDTYNNLFYGSMYGSKFSAAFANNTIESNVFETIVEGTFQNNFITGATFNYNVIGSNFTNNNIHSVFDSNKTGYFFDGNTTWASFSKNKIGTDFYNNTIYSNFNDNTILNDFNTCTIGSFENLSSYSFENNEIMNTFKGNNIQNNFWSNRIKSDFKGNIIDGEFGYNNIGFGCFVNNFIGETLYNTIGDYFVFNNCEGSFSYNIIGSYFYSNDIGDGFGFGGSQSRGNRIGSNFYDNTIGEYFYNNKVEENFNNNIVGTYFQLNDIKIDSLNSTNFSTYHGNLSGITHNNPSSNTDNVYTVSQSDTTGHGYDATFTVTVSGGVVTSVVILNSGVEYNVGDQITIGFGQFDGLADLIINVTQVSEIPMVYRTANSTIFLNNSGIPRLSYYDGNDVLTITDIIN